MKCNYLYDVAGEALHAVEGLVDHLRALGERLEHVRLLLREQLVGRVTRGRLAGLTDDNYYLFQFLNEILRKIL